MIQVTGAQEVLFESMSSSLIKLAEASFIFVADIVKAVFSDFKLEDSESNIRPFISVVNVQYPEVSKAICSRLTSAKKNQYLFSVSGIKLTRETLISFVGVEMTSSSVPFLDINKNIYLDP